MMTLDQFVDLFPMLEPFKRSIENCIRYQQRLFKGPKPSPAQEEASITNYQTRKANEASSHMKFAADFLKCMWITKQYSDLIVMGGSEASRVGFKVHRMVLACQSAVFSAAFSKEKVANEVLVEANPEIFMIPDFPAETVEGMLNFLYNGTIHEENAIKLFYIAHKYQVTRLKEICQTIIINSINTENALEIFKLAQAYMSTEVIEAVFQAIQNAHEPGSVGSEFFYLLKNLEAMVQIKKSRKRKLEADD